jgi:hypothetical protein
VLVNLKVTLQSGEEVDFGGEAWFEDLKALAAAHPGSNAEHTINLAPWVYGDLPLRNPEPGVYYASNFGNLLEDCGFKIERYPDTAAMARWKVGYLARMARRNDPHVEGAEPDSDSHPYPNDDPNPYGVADNLDQVKKYLACFIDHPTRDFVIEVSEIKRDPTNAGQGGGWRWHKWGPYIGTFESKCEYLDDEEGIDGVLLFHIHEILPEDGHVDEEK